MASGGYSLVRVESFSLQSTGLSSCGFQALEHRLRAVAPGLRCSEACGIFPGQELNPCLLHWQADSLPLNHQGNPCEFFLINKNLAVKTSNSIFKLGRCFFRPQLVRSI